MSTQRPGTESLLREAAYRQLESAGRRGLDPHGIEAPAGLEVDPERLSAALAELESEGRAVEWSRRWYALRFTEFVAGRIKRLEGGDALLLTGERGEAGYFIPRKLAKGSMDGDLVLARPHKKGPKGRRMGGERLPEASVVKMVQRRHQTMVGTVDLDEGDRRWLVPFDPKADFDLEVMDGEEVAEEEFVVVAVEPPRPGAGHPRGRIVEVLGDPAVPGVDVKVVLRHYRIPEDFPPEVIAESERHPEDPTAEDWAGREDLRDAPHHHHRRRHRPRLRRRGLGRAPRQALPALGPHRRRRPLRAGWLGARPRGLPPRHQRLLSGPRDPHAPGAASRTACARCGRTCRAWRCRPSSTSTATARWSRGASPSR